MRSLIGTALQVFGITAACVAAFTISYSVGALAASAALVFIGLAVDS